MTPKQAMLSKMFIAAHSKKDYSTGFTFMRGLIAMSIEYESDDYFLAREVIATQFGAQEASALDNAFIKSTHE